MWIFDNRITVGFLTMYIVHARFYINPSRETFFISFQTPEP